jgi:pyochelin synthetase
MGWTRGRSPATDADLESAEIKRFLDGCRGDDRFEPFPLTDLQSAYWQGARPGLELSGIMVHYYYEFELDALDVDRLERAVNRLIEHHPMLRAVLDPDGRQRILPDVPRYRISVTDLSQLDEQAERAARQTARDSVLRIGPDTESWPALGLAVYRLRGGANLLQIDLPILFMDGTSIELVIKDLQRLYAELEADVRAPGLWPRDYLMAVLAQRAAEPYQRSLEYWRGRLPTLPSGPDLPLTGQPIPWPLRFHEHRGELDADTWGRFKELAYRHKLTSATAVATVYAEVLATWSRSQHFLINVLSQGRVPCGSDMDRLIGNFSTTVMLEVDHTARDEPFAVRALRLRNQLRRDLEHSRVSGVHVARELARRRGGLPRPIAPAVFSSQLSPPQLNDPDILGAWGPSCVFEAVRTPQVWLEHQIREQSGRFIYIWDTVDDLFPPGIVKSIFDAYQERLAILGRSEAAWTAPSAVSIPPAQIALRERVNRTEVPVSPATLHGLFVDRSGETPDALAVISRQRRLRYGELEAWSRNLAARLPDRGLIAIYMQRGWEQVVAALSILRAGAAYLPIDPALPEKRVRLLLDGAGVEVVVTQPGLGAAAAVFGRQVVVIDQPPADEVALKSLPEVPTDWLAYVIYTSGSTGTPKGVMIDHRGAVNTVLDINRRFGVDSSDRVLALSSLSFDLSVYDLFGTFAAGAAVVIPDAELDREPAHWVELVERERVTVWNSVPQLLVMLVEHLRYRAAGAVQRLRLVLLSGDWIPVSLPDEIRALVPAVRVIGMGGATEASIWSIFHDVDEVDPSWKSIPYGRPLANQRWHVLNDALEPAPTWVPGELFIGGVGLALGYLGDEATTRHKFIDHPSFGRLYRTGDLGRYLPAGELEFLGREDAQVKVQGYRIELGEIEAVLQEHPEVRAAVVVAPGEPRGERRLVGYVVPVGAEIDLAAVESFAEARIPAYMVPGSLQSLPELPLSSNGKVDRKALAARPPERGETGAPRPPSSDLERRLCAIWQELLEVQPIGVNQDFFDLGGQSFLAVRLMARVLRDFGVDLSVTTLIRAGTIESLAAVIEGQRSGDSPLVPLTVRETGPALFCVHPSGGSVLCYRDLARRLAGQVRFFGLEAPGLRGHFEAHQGIEVLAAHYLEAVRSVQPHGPYLLAGWSSGGAVALAMAHALRAAGQEVAGILLLDTEPPGDLSAADEDEQVLIQQFVSDLLRLGAGAEAADQAMRALQSQGAGARDPVAAAFALLRERNLLPSDFTEERFATLRRVYSCNLRGHHAYRPLPYGGEHWLFCARDGLVTEAGDPAVVWQPWILGAPRIVEVPGDHYTMFLGDNLDALAKELTQALRACASPARAVAPLS